MSSYVTGLVIQKNNLEQYICEDFQIGQYQMVPCPQGNLSQLVSDVWCVPVVDSGLFLGVKFEPGGYAQTVGPTAQSFQCVRVDDDNSSDVWFVRGNSQQFIAACDACCGNTGPTLPTNTPPIAPCQDIYGDGAGVTTSGCTGVFSLPSLAAGFGYLPTVYFNNVLLTVSPNAAGYTSVSSLLAYLNSVASSAGTWTASSDNITLIVTPVTGAGFGTVCAKVIAVNASGGSPF